MDELQSHERESGRQRALRIPLAYHRSMSWTTRTKLVLSALAAAGGLGYVLWVLLGGGLSSPQVSHGPLAGVHAIWESDCLRCHVPLTPLRPDAGGVRAAASLFGRNSSAIVAHSAVDAKCNVCHLGAVHHSNQIEQEVESCSGCHTDHAGRSADIVRQHDSHCTRCHANIAAHRKPGGAGIETPIEAPIADVARFQPFEPGEKAFHPAFRSLDAQQDPGNIRFSHRLHMAAGQLYPGQASPAGKTLAQLTCASCHEAEGSQGNGAYMRPINYEQHCRACHPLQIPGHGENTVPHGLAAKQLESTVAGVIAAGDKASPEGLSPARPIPGKTPRSNLADTLDPPQKLQVDQRLKEIRDNVCAKCHAWQEKQPTEVMPSAIPAVWLVHAKFDHSRHRGAITCQQCHPQAFDKLPARGEPGKLGDNELVMIPNIGNCARCHAPRDEAAGSGGARFDCAECHRYHGGDNTTRLLLAAGPLATEKLARQYSRPDRELVIRTVADAAPPKSPAVKHPFIGSRSCSATGCHGDVRGNDGVISSYTRFTAADPHRQAFYVLYADPSIRMFRLLSGQPEGEVDDAQYLAFLEQKCVGCHATPPSAETARNGPEKYLLGIGCESCHGPADQWQATHYQRGTSNSKDFRNLNDLSVRARVCAECHIGPKEVLGKSYDVNHDLIAAGHPRLTFEFEAQSANLPSHWGPVKNIKSHFDAWRLGELAVAEQQNQLHRWRADEGKKGAVPSPELASHRCFDCHHGLSSGPAVGRISFAALHRISPEEKVWLSRSSSSPQDRQAILRKLLDRALDEQQPASPGSRWEDLVRTYLAMSAYVADLPSGSSKSNLAARHAALREILTKSFRSSAPERKIGKEEWFAGGPYDSPTGFNPEDESLKATLVQIRASLAPPSATKASKTSP